MVQHSWLICCLGWEFMFLILIFCTVMSISYYIMYSIDNYCCDWIKWGKIKFMLLPCFYHLIFFLIVVSTCTFSCILRNCKKLHNLINDGYLWNWLISPIIITTLLALVLDILWFWLIIYSLPLEGLRSNRL